MKLHLSSRGLAAAAVVAALATAVPSVAAQASTSPRAQTSGGVVQRYLAAHGSHFETSGYPDYGLTLDGIIALDSAGVGDDRSARATAYVADHIDDYVGSGTEQYAGATAKALLVALSQRLTPKGNLGGVDLVTRLESLQTPSGRFSDKSQYGDYSNVIGQSYALVSLARAGERLSYPAISFLRKQQCTNGGFQLNPTDGGCASPSKADPDATSFAVQGLLAAPATQVTKRRIVWAVRYLRSKMSAAGGVRGGTGTSTVNANSTGLAVMSLDSAGYHSLASRGRHYLSTLRFGCAYPASMRGGVAYDRSRIREARSQHSKATLSDQDLRTTTQAVLGFSGTSLLRITNKGAKHSSPRVPC